MTPRLASPLAMQTRRSLSRDVADAIALATLWLFLWSAFALSVSRPLPGAPSPAASAEQRAS